MKQGILIIIDGWGIAPDGPGNAITQSNLNIMPKLWRSYPHTLLKAAGSAVGLPETESGNSETGHINIGAGRLVPQDLQRINRSIEEGSFFRNEAFIGAIRHVKDHHSNLHIMGVLSTAGVHASKDHLCSLLKLIDTEGKIPVFLHLFTDGRDALPKSALEIFTRLEKECVVSHTSTHIATIMGRYYGMDRDRRWERTETAYDGLTDKSTKTASSATQAIQAAYERGETDEFITPTVMTDTSHTAFPRISDNDAVIFYNFRIDRPRQLTRAFVLPDFETHKFTASIDPYAEKYYHKHTIDVDERSTPFQRKKILKNLFFVTMTEYEQNTPCVAAFPPRQISEGIAETIARQGIRQLHASESEKERMVTYYFNGLKQSPYSGEDRLIVPSPDVPTYDLQPEMSARILTDQFIDRMRLGIYGFGVINFANPDMVGHTGSIEAAKKACEVVDECIGRIVEHVNKFDGVCFITADHGNVEEMLTTQNEKETEHSKNPVPLICCSASWYGLGTQLPSGALGDIGPTLLGAMGVPTPLTMSGHNLLEGGVS